MSPATIEIPNDGAWHQIGILPFTAKKGVVLYGYSMSFRATVNDKLLIRFSFDNGTNWANHIFEAKDSNEIHPVAYFFPKVISPDVINSNFIFEAMVLTGDQPAYIDYLDLMVDQKG